MLLIIPESRCQLDWNRMNSDQNVAGHCDIVPPAALRCAAASLQEQRQNGGTPISGTNVVVKAGCPVVGPYPVR
jgi:hypothetical protein